MSEDVKYAGQALIPTEWVEAAYGRHIDYMLRNGPLLGSAQTVKYTRRERLQRRVSATWHDFRYSLAKRIYDFPEEPW